MPGVVEESWSSLCRTPEIPRRDSTVCFQPSLSWLHLPPLLAAEGISHSAANCPAMKTSLCAHRPSTSLWPLWTEQDGKSVLELKAGFQPSLGSRLKPGVRPELWQAEEEHVSSGPSLSAADECFMGRREHSRSLLLMWATQNHEHTYTQRHLCTHTS